MNYQLPKLLAVLILFISMIACSNDGDDLGYEIETINIPIIDEPYHEPHGIFKPEIIVTKCFTGSAFYSIDNPNNEKYGYNWSYEGAAMGHDYKTSCLCGGTLELRVTRLEDGATCHAVMDLYACNTQIK